MQLRSGRCVTDRQSVNRRARCSVSQQTQAKNPSQCHKPQAEARNGASRRGSPWPPPRQDEGPRTAKSNSVTLLSQEEVLDDAASTCIVVHERFPALVDAFLEYKLLPDPLSQRASRTNTHSLETHFHPKHSSAPVDRLSPTSLPGCDWKREASPAAPASDR